jgi:hypothetical protein
VSGAGVSGRLLVEEGRKAGRTFALCHGLTILSRDTSEYERAHRF